MNLCLFDNSTYTSSFFLSLNTVTRMMFGEINIEPLDYCDQLKYHSPLSKNFTIITFTFRNQQNQLSSWSSRAAVPQGPGLGALLVCIYTYSLAIPVALKITQLLWFPNLYCQPCLHLNTRLLSSTAHLNFLLPSFPLPSKLPRERLNGPFRTGVLSLLSSLQWFPISLRQKGL